MLEKVIDWLNNFENVIEVSVLEDNKYTIIEDKVFEKDTFIRELSKSDFQLMGLGEREFHIKIKEDEFTIQISNFAYETDLPF